MGLLKLKIFHMRHTKRCQYTSHFLKSRNTTLILKRSFSNEDFICRTTSVMFLYNLCGLFVDVLWLLKSHEGNQSVKTSKIFFDN